MNYDDFDTLHNSVLQLKADLNNILATTAAEISIESREDESVKAIRLLLRFSQLKNRLIDFEVDVNMGLGVNMAEIHHLISDSDKFNKHVPH